VVARRAYETGPDPAGRLFRLRLEKSRQARAAAVASVRGAGFGRYVYARIGGAKRGTEALYDNLEAALRAIDRHYDAAMMRHVTRKAL